MDLLLVQGVKQFGWSTLRVNVDVDANANVIMETDKPLPDPPLSHIDTAKQYLRQQPSDGGSSLYDHLTQVLVKLVTQRPADANLVRACAYGPRSRCVVLCCMCRRASQRRRSLPM